MLPFMSSDFNTSAWDGIVRDSLKIDVNGGPALMSVISREVIEKSQSTFNAVCSRFGVDPRNVKMRTSNGHEENLTSDGWNTHEKLVGPWYADMPAAA